MGKQRKRHAPERKSPGRRRVSLLLLDLDFNRGSRPFGRGSHASPGCWAPGRAGLVYADWDGRRLTASGSDLIDGPRVATRLVAALGRSRRLIVGHGLISADLRAVAMVAEVSPALASRCVDTLALTWRLSGKRLPSGCGLSDLARANLGVAREKPAVPDWAGPAQRGNADPRDDAWLTGRIWQTMLTTRALAWEAGPGLSGSPAGAAALSGQHIAELTGNRPQPEAEAFGIWLGHCPVTARALPGLDPVREIAGRLQQAGLIDPGPLSAEELLTACQWMGPGQDLDVRERIATGRRLTLELRRRLGQALWESQHADLVNEFMECRRLARTSTTAYIRSRENLATQNRIRGQIDAAIGR